jgi:hypothetical protein
MYPMSMSAANQLVSDRRAAHEAAATRHRMRRLFSRRTAAAEAPAPAPVARPVLIAVACEGAEATSDGAERTVA